MAKSIYGRYVEVREERGKPTTQHAVAADLGVHQTAVHKWESGKGNPKPAHIYKMAENEGVCPNWLMAGVGPKYPVTPDVQALFDELNSMTVEDRARALKIARALRQ